MEIALTSKRDVIRNHADFSQHFVCTKRGSTYGIWINWEEAEKMGEKEFIAFAYDIYTALKT